MASGIEAFGRTNVYDTRAPVAAVLADLRRLRDAGRAAASRRSLFLTLFIISLAIVPFAVCAGLPKRIADEPAIGLPIAAGLAAACVVPFVLWRRYRRRCFEPRLVGLLERSLDFVSRDMAPDAPVAVRLDLRPPAHPAKLARTGKVRDWTVKYYVDPWLRLGGRLLDGTDFRLAATTRRQERRKWKRSRSGKYKSKNKAKESTALGLRLRFKPRRYPDAAAVPTADGAVRMPAPVQVRRLAVQDGSAALDVKLPDWDNRPAADEASPTVSGPHVVALLFLSLYQILNLSKAAARSQGGGS